MNIFYSAYDTLGVEATDSSDAVKRRYKELIRQYSPEKSPEKFSEIREAFECITTGDLVKKDKMPLYKSPIAWLEAKEEAERLAAKPTQEPLSTVFETPYNTLVELRNLMKKYHQKW